MIDIGINLPQSVRVAPEDRALQDCNSRAEVTLHTAGRGPFRVACRPGNSCRSKSKAKNPRGFGEQSPLIPLFNTKENRESRARLFGGSTNESSKIATDNYLDGLLAGFGRRCV
jgi:hypothetical protein